MGHERGDGRVGQRPLVIRTGLALDTSMFSRLPRRFTGSTAVPTLLHLTHAKAGSTWITVILHERFGENVAPRGKRAAETSGGDLAQHVFETGRVYPSMFMTRGEVLAHPELNGCKRFVVIRDLRDTMAALYFSLRMSANSDAESRTAALPDDAESALLEVIDSRAAGIAAIQTSWQNQGEIVLRYEELIEHGVDILRDAFIGRLALPISESALVKAVRNAPSERGRRTGAVDWRKHFTPKVRARFAEKFGQVLIDTGYEKDPAWAREPSSTQSPAGL